LVLNHNLRRLASYDWSKAYTECVNRHNTLRTKHHAGKLTVLSDLAKLAQTTANNCKAKGTLIHSGTSYNGKWMGQNLYLSGTTGTMGPSGTEIANSWYSENVDYNYSTGQSKNGNVVGHFTQLVWKSSKQIGCALAKGPWLQYNRFYVCCNYFPGGNVQGQYIANVLKP